MNKTISKFALALAFTALTALPTSAHETHADATYLANEAILVSQGDVKILFDPFFPSGFGTYQEVSPEMRSAIMKNEAPFGGIDAVFVSHVHPDHFSATDMVAYMEANKSVHLFVSTQGVEMMGEETSKQNEIFKRVHGIALKNGDAPKTITVGKIKAETVRIPHSGWPTRMENVSNLVFRVTLDSAVTVIHMGDADVNDDHFSPHNAHWQARTTDHAFPPYWFLGSDKGNTIATTRINAKKATGIHVPIIVPTELTSGTHDYFSKPGESRVIRPTKDKDHE